MLLFLVIFSLYFREIAVNNSEKSNNRRNEKNSTHSTVIAASTSSSKLFYAVYLYYLRIHTITSAHVNETFSVFKSQYLA